MRSVEKEILLRVERRFDAHAPAIDVARRVPQIVEVVVDMHLTEPHARRALANAVEHIVMQRHAQLAAIVAAVVPLSEEPISIVLS